MAAEMLKIRILLVEDEPLIRMLVAETLRDEGFEVIEASDADGAIFAVLLTDIRMPGKFDGLGVAAWARALDPSMPLIIATGYADELTQRLKAFGPPVLLLKKPYRLVEAVEAIRKVRSGNSVLAK